MEQVPKPSGLALPLLLRRKWRDQKINAEPSPSSTVPSTSVAPIITSSSSLPNDEVKVQSYPGLSETENSMLSNRIFTADEIEERMERIYKVALVDIQKQIHRGEETYYEDTYAHGNLFRGWDAFVDSKDVAGSASAPPADSRWFSASCRSVSRTVRPTQPLVRTTSLATSSTTPTTVTSSNLSETNSSSSALAGASAPPTLGTTPTALPSQVAASISVTTAEEKKSENNAVVPAVSAGQTSATSKPKDGPETQISKDEGANLAESNNKRKERAEESAGDKSEEPPEKKPNIAGATEEPIKGADKKGSSILEQSATQKEATNMDIDEPKKTEEKSTASTKEAIKDTATGNQDSKNETKIEEEMGETAQSEDTLTETPADSIEKSKSSKGDAITKKDEKQKKGEPQKRRSSRNRRSS
jgi:hypothetical protein